MWFVTVFSKKKFARGTTFRIPYGTLFRAESLVYRALDKSRNQNGDGMSEKVWFITGTSRGFGRVWADAALNRGDKVAATARTLDSIADLKEKYGANVLTLELDVTRPDQVKEAVTQAHAHFGRLDVVVNNVGYALIGTIEEASAEDVRALYEYHRGAFGHSGSTSVAARARWWSHSWYLEHPWSHDHAAHWLLLFLKVGV